MSDPAEPKGATVSLALPEATIEGIRRRLRGSHFRSPEEFVTFVLDRLLEAPPGSSEVFSEEDEERLRTHLRRLGYLD